MSIIFSVIYAITVLINLGIAIMFVKFEDDIYSIENLVKLFVVVIGGFLSWIYAWAYREVW